MTYSSKYRYVCNFQWQLLSIGINPWLETSQCQELKISMKLKYIFLTSRSVLDLWKPIPGWQSGFVQAIAGLSADGRQIVNRAIDEASQYRK